MGSIFSGLWAGIRTTAITQLVAIAPQLLGSLLPVVGVVGILPGALAAAAIPLATLVVGFQGFGKALKDAGSNPKQFAKDLQNMSPAAQSVVKALLSLKTGFKQLQLDVQNKLFVGLGTEIRQVGQADLPVLTVGMSKVAVALNSAALSLGKFLGQAGTRANLGSLFSSAASAAGNFGATVAPLAAALLTIATVGAQAFARLTSNLGNLATQFNAFVQRVAGSGQLFAWIEQGISTLYVLGDVFKNVAEIIVTLLSTLDTTGGTFLETLASLTGELEKFLKSAQGQAALKAIGQLMAVIGNTIGPIFLKLLQTVAQVIVNLSPELQQLVYWIGTALIGAINVLAPILTGLTKLMGDNATATNILVIALAALFTGLKVAAVVTTLITALKKLMTTLEATTVVETITAIATGALDVVMGILEGILGVLLSPITLIIAAIAALAAVVFLLVTHWTQVSEFLAGTWKNTVALGTSLWNTLSAFFKKIWSDIVGFAKAIWQPIVTFFVGLWSSVSGAVVAAWNAISNALLTAWRTIVNATRPIWQPIVGIIEDILIILKDIIIIVVGGIAIALIAAWNAIRAAALAVWGAISAALQAVWNAVAAAAQAIWTPVAAFFTALWNTVSTFFQAVWNIISARLQANWTIIVAVARAIWTPIAAFFTNLWNTVRAVIENAWALISSIVSARVHAIVAAIEAIFTPVVNFFRTIWNAVSTAVSQGFQAVVNFFASIGGKILNALGDVGQILFNAGLKLIEGFLDGIKNAFDQVKNFVGGIAGWITSHKGPPEYDATLLTNAGKLIMQSLIDGMQSKMDPLAKFLGGVSNTITDSLASTSASVNLTGVTGGAPGTGGGGIAPVVVQQTNNMLPGTDPYVFAQQAAAQMSRALSNNGTVLQVQNQPVTPGMTNRLLSVGGSL